MKYTCALQLAGCYETTIGFRGICSNCYNILVESGEIDSGDKFSDFPEWLQKEIRYSDSEDHRQIRHPEEEYEEEFISETRIPLGEGCYKSKKLTCV